MFAPAVLDTEDADVELSVSADFEKEEDRLEVMDVVTVLDVLEVVLATMIVV